ncbi:MAG: sugar nucleotide-binding protein, partial [Bdellovibrionota bacterium]
MVFYARMTVIFGKHGQLASSFRATRMGRSATYLSSADVCFTKSSQIVAALDRLKPKVIVNAAAYTQVDKAEDEKEICTQINADSVGVIADWAAANEATLVHFSTDYVFAGNGDNPWTEACPAKPVNWYGESKLLGEQKITASGCHSVIFRTSWIFSEHGKNFVKTMLHLGKS